VADDVEVVPNAASTWDCANSAATSSSLVVSSVLLHCSQVVVTIVDVGVLNDLVDEDVYNMSKWSFIQVRIE
jgi:hypothetical protein